MKKHLIIFFCYNNSEHIKQSFESIKNYDADFFVIENPSKNSKEIKEYFLKQNLLAYFQFHNNVCNSAIKIILNEFWQEVIKYEYLTITDGDLFVFDIKSTFNEMFLALQNKEIIVASGDLWQGNNYTFENKKGLKEYKIESANNDRLFGCVEGITGAFLITLKNENFFILKDLLFVDSYLAQKVHQMKKRWFKTNKNLLYHLTWDLYVDGNEYFEYKKEVFDKIFFQEKYSGYDKII
jgi:hypothetical protein